MDAALGKSASDKLLQAIGIVLLAERCDNLRVVDLQSALWGARELMEHAHEEYEQALKEGA